MARRFVVAVIGTGREVEPLVSNARELGRRIAEQGWVLISGGRDSGVMKAANGGAKEAKDSLTIGILPNPTADVSPDVDVAIVTDTGEARNNIIVLSADLIIACGASDAGTASEVALAIKNGKHLIMLEASDEAKKFFGAMSGDQMTFAESPDDAIRFVKEWFAGWSGSGHRL